MSVIVSLALATICFTANGAKECHPVLIGKETPTGMYQLMQRYVLTPGYGGDVLQFREHSTTVDAIHRTWQGSPEQKRDARYKSTNTKVRMITKGCINVEEHVYQKLVDCCSNDKLEITK